MSPILIPQPSAPTTRTHEPFDHPPQPPPPTFAPQQPAPAAHPQKTRSTLTTIKTKTSTLFLRHPPASTQHRQPHHPHARPSLSPQTGEHSTPATAAPPPPTSALDPLVPRVHGIVPRPHSDIVLSSSPETRSLATSTVATAPPTPKPSSPADWYKYSAYPRVSPPGFLYPVSIVPHRPAQQRDYLHHRQDIRTPISAQRHTQRHDMYVQANAAAPTGMDDRVGILSGEMTFLFGVSVLVVVLAVLWTLLAWCVNFPPGSWTCWECNDDSNDDYFDSERHTKAVKNRKKRWLFDLGPWASWRPWTRDAARQTHTQKFGDDKTAHTYKMQPYTTLHDEQDGPGTAVTTAIHPPAQHYPPHHRNIPTNDLTRRTQHTRVPFTKILSYTPPSPSSPPRVRFSITSSPSSSSSQDLVPGDAEPLLTSPMNPFLVPPTDFLSPLKYDEAEVRRKRDEGEWLRERAEFFGERDGSCAPPDARQLPPQTKRTTSTHASVPSTAATTTATPAISQETLDVRALEAGTPLLQHIRDDKPGETLLKRSLSLLDQGLGYVDGAVDRMVGKVVEWTEDEDGEVLLPVARGRA
ncbi:hypothetical protein IQ07DRAFT_679404 [Pyrenochaeta sp. DS3sAY3a]|nr:hypothetical protein IQ07DRAFT_679404 [Pyrenochaeta sp. DS3sAY3a]